MISVYFEAATVITTLVLLGQAIELHASPMIDSAAMTFSSVSVILNALRLRNLKL